MVHPEKVPASVDDLGVRRDLVSSLALRTLAFANRLSMLELCQRLAIPQPCLKPLIEEFREKQLVESKGYGAGLEQFPLEMRETLEITRQGQDRAESLGQLQTRYLGPCPISFDDYVALLRGQMSKRNSVTDERLKQALSDLELEPGVIDQIGGAMVSRSSLFIFGAPGNGKSTITERMAHLLGEVVEVPYAVAVGEEIIRLIDPVYHRMAPQSIPQPQDRRLLRVMPPVVIAGGELKLNQLELVYDPQNRYYEAPLHWKSNAGILVIDDFGRQEVPPMRLLNRFIVPMEKKIDYLDLSASGRKIELPFLCQLVFSTNISPAELVDEAFLRRMAYKIGVGNPSRDAYTRILKRECEKNHVAWAPEVESQIMPYLFQELYGPKPLRGSHPKQIVNRLVDLAAFRQRPPQLTREALKEAFDACFNPALGNLQEADWAAPPVTGTDVPAATPPSSSGLWKQLGQPPQQS